MKLGYDTAKTLNSLADKLQEVGKQPEKYELDAETHAAILVATEKLQQLLAKVTHITS